jgi:dinuclear metal center YbgI/SA1388 family protein
VASSSPTVGDVVAAMQSRYRPEWAEAWDAVGLTCGDPAREIGTVLFAVDATPAVVDEAVRIGAQMLITHHPLLFRPVHSVSADTWKGLVVHRLIEAGCGLFTAHTNADRARPGVSDALADALGLVDTAPLVPLPSEPLDKIVVFVPIGQEQELIDAMAAEGAGAIGDYSRCAWTTTGVGTFRPGLGATPSIGTVGAIEIVDEQRVEMVLPSRLRAPVIAAMRATHPYEEPAFDVLQLAPFDTSAGLGRIGTLPEPRRLADFVTDVAGALPVGAAGVRATGSPDRLIARVAVCGGAGGSVLETVRRTDADVYVTADLSHHTAGEFIEGGWDGPALVDATHFGTEWPWLAQAADLLIADLSALGSSVATVVSRIPTDPWRMHAAKA